MAGCPGLKSGKGRCTGCHNGSGGYMGPNGCTGCSFGNSNRTPTGTTTRRWNNGFSSSNSVRIPVVAPVTGSWSNLPTRNLNFFTRRAPETRSWYQSNYISPSFNRNIPIISNPTNVHYDAASSHAETDSVHVVNGYFSRQQSNNNKNGQGSVRITNEDTTQKSSSRTLHTFQINQNNG